MLRYLTQALILGSTDSNSYSELDKIRQRAWELLKRVVFEVAKIWDQLGLGQPDQNFLTTYKQEQAHNLLKVAEEIVYCLHAASGANDQIRLKRNPNSDPLTNEEKKHFLSEVESLIDPLLDLMVPYNNIACLSHLKRCCRLILKRLFF